MEAGQTALVPVTFIERRNERALVRLPNGSKTSLSFNALAVANAVGHYVRDQDNGGVTVYCLRCQEWSTHEALWMSAYESLVAHDEQAHP